MFCFLAQLFSNCSIERHLGLTVYKPSMPSLQFCLVLICGFFVLSGQVRSQRLRCGKSSNPPSQEGYVMGGENAEQGAWPWMAVILMANAKGVPVPICTGFLIDKKHVLSAAHCFEGNQTHLFSALIGHVDLTRADSYPIVRIAVPGGYRDGLFYDDIALLTLSREVDVPDFNPVCLPPPRALRNLTGRGTTVVGWGSTKPGEPMSTILKQLSAMPVLSNAVCSRAYGERFEHLLPQGITSRMLCAGFLDEPGKDSCVGDSGGPLLFQEQNRWYAVGVVSFGYMCGRTDYPGVYTRVSEYDQWIKRNIKLENDSTPPVIPPDSPKPPVIPSSVTVEPVRNPPDDPVESIRFGTTQYSRQEFAKDAGFLESVLDDSVFSLEFKTKKDSGVLFYVGGKPLHPDFIALFMQDGRMTYSFDCGSGIAVMTSHRAYNDDRWHRVVFSRKAREGRLVVDDREEVRGSSLGDTHRADLRDTFFVGGLSEIVAQETKNSLKGVNSSFPGCIRNVEAQGEQFTVANQNSAWNTSSCSSTVEGGSVCSAGGGCYVLSCECADHTTGCKFQENGVKKCLCGPGFEEQGGKCKEQHVPDGRSSESVRFGTTPYSRQEYSEFDSEFLESILDDAVFSLEFKTFGVSGALFYIGGMEPLIDYMGLFMQDGKVTFVFDCGSGSAALTSLKRYNDGEWHQVVFSRQAREGRLVIDDTEEVRGTSPGVDHRMNVKYPFYVGGLSPEASKEYKDYLRGFYLSFPGCIRNEEAQGMLWTSKHRSADYKTTTCSSKVEGGTFFYSSGGYLVLHCKCGDYSTGCRFKEDGAKECLCSEGYVDRRGVCKVFSSSMVNLLEAVPHSGGVYAGQCVLPLNPRPDSNPDPPEGVRFGNTPHSRQEFAVSGEFLEGVLDDSAISLDFKTTGESGVLFYIGEGVQHLDYVGLYMKGGQIFFGYELATGSTALVSRNRYNDGTWHHVVFWRHVREGRLVIDGADVIQGVSPGGARGLNVKSPFYIGGLSEEAAKQYAKNIGGVSSSFPGCIWNVEFQNVLWTPEMQSGAWNTTTCSRTEERGTFFSAGGGHVVLADKFRVGQEITISMDIKPRNLSGVLLAVHGRQDYLILQLVDGRIDFTVDNGNGPITATYTPTDSHLLCDGRFHTVLATSRSNSHVTLAVDGVVSEKGLSVSRVSSTDTFNPLYVGGLPSSSLSKKGVKTTDHFVGCIRNLELNDKPQSMGLAKPFGHVALNTCPTT